MIITLQTVTINLLMHTSNTLKSYSQLFQTFSLSRLLAFRLFTTLKPQPLVSQLWYVDEKFDLTTSRKPETRGCRIEVEFFTHFIGSNWQLNGL